MDELDEALDVRENSIFRDVDLNLDPDPSDLQLVNDSSQQDLNDGLGLEKEVKVAKKRAPIAKLDEERLLSAAGIPKLRRSAKAKLRFKGKGHEFTNLARLLDFYQLWLDDLYPRAKFADGLIMIEKLGHQKRIQGMRKAWTDEDRAARAGFESESGRETTLPTRTSLNEAPRANGGDLNTSDSLWEQSIDADGPGQDGRRETGDANGSLFVSVEGVETGGAPPEDDDLDAILAENDMRELDTARTRQPATGSKITAAPSFEDEEDAMAGLDEFW